MHRREIGFESRISRAREKFNDANSTHYIQCTEESRGMLCLLSPDADVRVVLVMEESISLTMTGLDPVIQTLDGRLRGRPW
jgi:hypothetical protein